MLFKGVSDLARHIGSQIQSGTVNNATMAQAQAKAKQWADRVHRAIRAHIPQQMYKPGGNVVYRRTGQIFSRLATDYNVGNNIASAYVHYTEYPSHSVFGSANDNYDVTQLLEEGYAVRSGLWFSNKPYFGYRKGAHLLSFVVGQLQAAAAADGVVLSVR